MMRIAGCVLVLVLAAPGVRSLSAQKKAAAGVPRAKAIELYKANCQICHGPGGTGSALMAGSAFVGRTWKHGNRTEDVVATVTNGVPGTMMLPFKGKLSPAEIDALAALVRSFDKKMKPAGPAPVKKQ